MKRYMIKGDTEEKSRVEVVEKDSRGYTVRVLKERRWGVHEELHRMSIQLFETCLRTGYFIEMKDEMKIKTA